MERRPFEKKVLVHGKPILCQFNRIPKEGKPAIFEGNESPRIALMFRVSDNKYPEVNGYPVFFRCNPWINNYQGKSTKLYDLLCKLAQREPGQDWCQVDARELPESDWQLFFGYYAVIMKAPEYEADGTTLKWQDIADILHPDGIEFPVESRKQEPNFGGQSGPIGLPVPKNVQTPPKQEDKPAPPQEAAPAQQVPPLQFSAARQGLMLIDEVLAAIREMVTPVGTCRTLANEFRLQKNAARISDLTEADLRLLHQLLRVEHYHSKPGYADAYENITLSFEKPLPQLSVKEVERALNLFEVERYDQMGNEYSCMIEEYMESRGAMSLLDLDSPGVALLLGRLNDLETDVPF